ncbi:MAG TPA: hypothetical protein VD886_23710, partial [Herpetosiphonaceae bacterium]|nr:hypothetical protein [Herpetosiphonaceae bacterium]
GGLGAVTISMVGATAEKDTLTIHGEDGAVRIEGGQVYRAGRGGEWVEQTPAHTVAIPEGIAGLFPVGTVYLGHALRAYGDGDGAALAAAATFADGLRIQRLLDAGRRSDAENGGWVAV